jgi:catechol 2,3-dioxygenase-like lactoylglutathione lyase family enzyme
MLTRIDHVVICVSDLRQGIETYTRLGFNVYPGGVHPGRGTHNAIGLNEDDYLELLSVRDPEEYRAATARPGRPGGGLMDFIAAGGGLRQVVVASDDLTADVAAMRGRGVDVNDPMEGSRRTDSGLELRWLAAALGPRHPLPVVFLQHLTPREVRRRQAPAAGIHPNRIQRIDRVYVVTADVRTEAEAYARVLGMPVPTIQRGTVIMADMAVFDLGPTGLSVAQPYASGPAADSLARRGPGPFQVLYRTSSMGAAARWMQDHGVPPPARGVRNTGEQAMLVPPEHAAGAYIGLVGPE